MTCIYYDSSWLKSQLSINFNSICTAFLVEVYGMVELAFFAGDISAEEFAGCRCLLWTHTHTCTQYLT